MKGIFYFLQCNLFIIWIFISFIAFIILKQLYKRNFTVKKMIWWQISSSTLMYTFAYLTHLYWAHLMWPALSWVQGEEDMTINPQGAHGLQRANAPKGEHFGCTCPSSVGRMASFLLVIAQRDQAARVASPDQNSKQRISETYSFAGTVCGGPHTPVINCCLGISHAASQQLLRVVWEESFHSGGRKPLWSQPH